MRKVLIPAGLLLLPLLAARAQVFLMVADYAHLQHYIDSITHHYYGDFYPEVGNVPIIPLCGSYEYRTPLVEIRTANAKNIDKTK